MKFIYIMVVICSTLVVSCGRSRGGFALAPASCSTHNVAGGVEVICPDGTTAFASNGVNGLNGHSALVISASSPNSTLSRTCSLMLAGTDLNDNNILDLNEVTATREICDGSNATVLNPVSYVNFCYNVRNFAEIGIRIGNVIVASFSANDAGDLTHLAILVPGTGYKTTDGFSCNFSVTSDGSIVH